MREVRTSGRGQVNRHTHPKRSLWKSFLCLLAFIYSPFITKGISSFQNSTPEELMWGKASILRLAVTGFPRYEKPSLFHNNWHGASNDTKPTLTIAFRDLDYAYDIFSGGITLKEGLSARLFTTHGPNDKGVAVTYLFNAILKTFFFWRSAYRRS